MFGLKRMKVDRGTDTANPETFETVCNIYVYNGSFPFSPSASMRLYRKRLIASISFSFVGPDPSNPGVTTYPGRPTYLEDFPGQLAHRLEDFAVPRPRFQPLRTNVPIPASNLGAEQVLAVTYKSRPIVSVSGAWWSSKTASIVEITLTEGITGKAALGRFAKVAAKIVPAYF
jgi:hypothetical protein